MVAIAFHCMNISYRIFPDVEEALLGKQLWECSVFLTTYAFPRTWRTQHHTVRRKGCHDVIGTVANIIRIGADSRDHPYILFCFSTSHNAAVQTGVGAVIAKIHHINSFSNKYSFDFVGDFPV